VLSISRAFALALHSAHLFAHPTIVPQELLPSLMRFSVRGLVMNSLVQHLKALLTNLIEQ